MWAYEAVYAEESVGAKTEKHKMAEAGRELQVLMLQELGVWGTETKPEDRAQLMEDPLY